jgi:hypothetical protein
VTGRPRIFADPGELRAWFAEHAATEPRRPGSTWSRVNIARFEARDGEGRIDSAGRTAYQARGRGGVYSHEQPPVSLDAGLEAVLRATPGAWDFFAAQPPSYRQAATWWVVSAKRADTRERRLAELAADSAAGRRVRHLRRP